MLFIGVSGHKVAYQCLGLQGYLSVLGSTRLLISVRIHQVTYQS